MADAHTNFAYSTVATAPSPASSGTSLVVAAGKGALFPTPPFNATVWPAGAAPLASNAEIVRVTAVSTDTFTITRTQESTSARTIVVGDQIAATVTAKTLTDIENSYALLASPTFTGTPAAPTAAADTNTTQLATTAYVVGQGYLKSATASSTYAPLASPTFTGTPAAPTAAASTNTTQVATTAFVLGQGNSTAGTIAMNGTQAAGTSNLYARADHVHPTDTSRAALASPTFTGTPAAPTAAVDTNTTQIATTAYVVGQGYLKSATASSTYAPLASPALTGTPTAPTAAVDTNTTQVATTAYVIGQSYLKTSTASSTYAPIASPSFTGVAKTVALQETKVAMSASDIDLSTANYFTKTISTTTTLTVSNVPSTGTAASFILDLTNGGAATVNWFSGVKWAGGTAPTLTAAGRDVLGFFTHDGGTTWSGLVLGKDVK